MKAEEREKVKSLINKYCTPFPLKYRVDSYIFKHLFEHLANIYIEHQEFKDIMQECGLQHLKERKNSNCRYYKIRVKDCDDIPPMYRGKGYEAHKYK